MVVAEYGPLRGYVSTEVVVAATHIRKGLLHRGMPDGSVPGLRGSLKTSQPPGRVAARVPGYGTAILYPAGRGVIYKLGVDEITQGVGFLWGEQ